MFLSSNLEVECFNLSELLVVLQFEIQVCDLSHMSYVGSKPWATRSPSYDTEGDLCLLCPVWGRKEWLLGISGKYYGESG